MLRSFLLYGAFERKAPVETYGTGNGAWNVVRGSLDKDSIVVAAGVGHDISFDLAVSRKYSCRIIMLDPSPTGITTVARHEPLPAGMTFEKIGLADKDGALPFAPPLQDREGSFRLRTTDSASLEFRFDCEKLGTLMKRHKIGKIDLLKLDIEGFEYAVLSDVLAHKLEVAQICVEFHHGIVPGVSRLDTIRAVLGLRRGGYILVNHDGLNHTFIRNDLLRSISRVRNS